MSRRRSPSSRPLAVLSPRRLALVALLAGLLWALTPPLTRLLTPPDPAARTFAAIEGALRQAYADAQAAGIHGPDLTPWLLARIATITDGRSVRANTALIVNNARVAGRLAVSLVARTAGRR